MIQIYQVLLYLSKKIIIKKFFVNGLFGHSILLTKELFWQIIKYFPGCPDTRKFPAREKSGNFFPDINN